MPRKKYVPAPDAARRRVDCEHYSFNAGAPRCKALTHPWCLAAGEAPEICRFRVPKETQGMVIFFEEGESGAIVAAAGAGSGVQIETESAPGGHAEPETVKPKGSSRKEEDGDGA